MTILGWLGVISIVLGLIVFVRSYVSLYSEVHKEDLLKETKNPAHRVFTKEFDEAFDRRDRAAVKDLMIDLAIEKLRSDWNQICENGVDMLTQFGGEKAFNALVAEMSENRPWALKARIARAVTTIASKLDNQD